MAAGVKSKVKGQRSKVKTEGMFSLAFWAYWTWVLSFLPLIVLSIVLSSGCGYRFAGVPTLPQGVKSVSFAEFENQTLEPGVEKELQWAFEREFRNHAGIIVAKQGEGILNVTLNDIHFRPLTFDQRDQVLEYEVALAFDISLTHRDTGNMLWQQNNIRIAEEYSAIPQVVVTTSPEFLQDTLDPKDLPGLTDIQFAETQRRLALERLLKEAAREAYFRIGEDF
jgi:outer membrane lipopolysaccharide assembly protein LptE/RlpB